MDGQRGDGHPEGVRLQGLHLRRVQAREGQLPREETFQLTKLQGESDKILLAIQVKLWPV